MAEEEGENRYVKGLIQTQAMEVDDTGALTPVVNEVEARDGGTALITTAGTGGAAVIVAARTGYTFHLEDVNITNAHTTTTQLGAINDGNPATAVDLRHHAFCGAQQSNVDTGLVKEPCTSAEGVYAYVIGAGAIGATVYITIGGRWTKNP